MLVFFSILMVAYLVGVLNIYQKFTKYVPTEITSKSKTPKTAVKMQPTVTRLQNSHCHILHFWKVLCDVSTSTLLTRCKDFHQHNNTSSFVIPSLVGKETINCQTPSEKNQPRSLPPKNITIYVLHIIRYIIEIIKNKMVGPSSQIIMKKRCLAIIIKNIWNGEPSRPRSQKAFEKTQTTMGRPVGIDLRRLGW